MKDEIIQFMEDALRDVDPNLSIERMHKIIFSIVSINFPVCAKKYLKGETWQLNREEE
jgi:hypothetical protein